MTELAHPDRLAKLEAIRAAGQDPFPRHAAYPPLPLRTCGNRRARPRSPAL